MTPGDCTALARNLECDIGRYFESELTTESSRATDLTWAVARAQFSFIDGQIRPCRPQLFLGKQTDYTQC